MPIVTFVPAQRNGKKKQQQAEPSFGQLLARNAPGDIVKIKVFRKGMTLVHEVKLGE